jgi:hypothetical protein
MSQYVLRSLNLLLFPVEMILASLLFIKKFSFRKFWRVYFLCGVAIIAGLSFLLTWLKSLLMAYVTIDEYSLQIFNLSYVLAVIIDLFLVAAYAAVIFIVWEIDFRNVIFTVCACFSMQNIARCLFVFFMRSKDPDEYSVFGSLYDPINLVVYICIYAAVFVACYFIFVKKFKSEDVSYINKSIFFLLICIILVNILMSGVYPPQNNQSAEPLYFFLIVCRILLSLLGLIMQFLILKWFQTRYDKEHLQQIMKKQRQQYEIAKENIDTVNINAHDLRRHVNTILNAVNDSGKTDALVGELKGMLDASSIADTIFNTGNTALDVVLTEKSRICLKNKISFSAMADGKQLNEMSEIDIYSLIGNALDNSIEATQRIKDEDARVISFYLRRGKGVIFIHVENTCITDTKFVDGIPQTIKDDKRMHGFGVKSMINIVKKYNGNLTLKQEGDMFYLDMIIPNRIDP